jgi:AraC-like DNA-binding protein
MAETPLSPPSVFREGCGVLRHSPSPGRYRHVRYAVPSELDDWIEHFWLENWLLPDGTSQTREVLPHPSVHLVFVPGRSRIYGVQTGRFVRQLQGEGRVLGIKFRPGAFYPFLRSPLHSIANKSISAVQVFSNAKIAEEKVLACLDDQCMTQMAAQFLMQNLPKPDPTVKIARRIVEEIVKNPEITRVDHLAARCCTTERALQRLFRCYVGASPRWVIKRYRMYEALQRLGDGTHSALASLALELGYFDQAHFSNDFKRLVGRAPSEYLDAGVAAQADRGR